MKDDDLLGKAIDSAHVLDKHLIYISSAAVFFLIGLLSPSNNRATYEIGFLLIPITCFATSIIGVLASYAFQIENLKRILHGASIKRRSVLGWEFSLTDTFALLSYCTFAMGIFFSVFILFLHFFQMENLSPKETKTFDLTPYVQPRETPQQPTPPNSSDKNSSSSSK